MLATIPSATSTISGIAGYANPWFTELLPWIEISIGIFVAVALANFIKNTFINITDTRFHPKRTEDETWRQEAKHGGLLK